MSNHNTLPMQCFNDGYRHGGAYENISKAVAIALTHKNQSTRFNLFLIASIIINSSVKKRLRV